MPTEAMLFLRNLRIQNDTCQAPFSHRYHASRILNIDCVVQNFDVQTLQILFFDTPIAFKKRPARTQELKKVAVRCSRRQKLFVSGLISTEEIDSRRLLKRSVEIRCVASLTTAEACLAWTSHFSKISPTLVPASFVPTREIMYLGFVIELGAAQFMKTFQLKAGQMGVEMDLLAGDHIVYPSLIMTLNLGASPSLAFTLNNVLRKKISSQT